MPQFHYGDKLTKQAKELRKNMTKEERHLWYDYLSGHKVKFYRQRPIDDLYIVDFYSLQAMLVIELDGSQHYEDDGLKKDMTRDRYLNKIGLRVVRIQNIDINRNFEGVCEYLDRVIAEQMAR